MCGSSTERKGKQSSVGKQPTWMLEGANQPRKPAMIWQGKKEAREPVLLVGAVGRAERDWWPVCLLDPHAGPSALPRACTKEGLMLVKHATSMHPSASLTAMGSLFSHW